MQHSPDLKKIPFRVPRAYPKKYPHVGIHFNELREVKIFMDMIAELNGYKNWIDMIRGQAWQMAMDSAESMKDTKFHSKAYDANLLIKLSTTYINRKTGKK